MKHKIQKRFGNKLPRKALQYRPQGKRDFGRPYRRWEDQFM